MPPEEGECRPLTDANHRFDDPERPVPWQGFTAKGPTLIGDNVWLGRTSS